MLARRSLLTLGLVTLTACAVEQPPPDTTELDRWLRRYVELLNNADEPALTRHLDRGGDTDAENRISRYGGRGLTVDYISMTSDFKYFYVVRIETTAADGKHMTLDEYAEWDGAHWKIAPVPMS